MFVFPQISYVKILTPKRMVLGGGAFGRCLGHEGRAFRNGIHVIKETHHRSLDPCIPRAHSEILAVCNLERYWRSAIWSDTGGLQSGTILAVCNLEEGLRPTVLAPPSGTVKNKFLLPVSYPVCDFLLEQPEQTKTK